MRPTRENLKQQLVRLNLDSESPAQAAAAYLLSGGILMQYQSGCLDPRQSIVNLRQWLQVCGITEIISFDAIYARAYDWLRFGGLISTEDFPVYLNLLFPCLIRDWFSDSEMKTFTNLSYFYRLLMIFFRLVEDPRYDPSKATTNLNDAYDEFSEIIENIGFNKSVFLKYWGKLFYSRVERPDSASLNQVELVHRVYKKYKYKDQKMLSDYLAMLNEDEIFPANPKVKNTKIEQGLTSKQRLFDSSMLRLQNFEPTDIIQKLFYDSGRDDIEFEYSWLFSQIKILSRNWNKCLLFNPSPLLLQELYKENPDWDLTVSVVDPTVRDLYQIQFPGFRFICNSELSDLGVKFDCLIIISRDVPYHHYRQAFDLCADDARVLVFGPETLISGSKSTFVSDLAQREIWPETILNVPKELTKSFGRKKFVMLARKGEVYHYKDFALMWGSVEMGHIYIDRQNIPVPMGYLNRHIGLDKMGIENNNCEEKIRIQEEPRIFDVSTEIKLYYVLLHRSDCISAKVCYRAVLDPKDKENKNRKRGEKKAGFTEKGMRGQTEDDVLSKIEDVAYYPEFFDVICEDIEEKYPEYAPLSMKTIWFLCRNNLKTTLGYNDKMMYELFRDKDHKRLWNMVPSDLSSEDIRRILADEVGEKKCERYLVQYHMIFRMAMHQRLLKEYPLEDLGVRTAQRHRKRMQELRNAMGKRFFTQDEEERIVQFLMETNGRKAVRRCVKESLLLVGLIRLFTGISLREVLALKWMHLQPGAVPSSYSFLVFQRMNDDGTITDFNSFRDRWKIRKIPLHPELTAILLERMAFLRDDLHFSLEEVLSQPIILEKEPTRNRRKCANVHCPIPVGRRISREILERAQIEEEKILLLDADARFEHDLNSYSGDLFHANYLHRLKYTCSFTQGQRCYVTGVQPPDTYSAHYTDYANALVQYQMICKLSRWTGKVLSYDRDFAWFRQEIQGEYTMESGEKPGLRAILDLCIYTDDTPGELEMIIESDHGVESTIRVYSTGGVSDDENCSSKKEKE